MTKKGIGDLISEYRDKNVNKIQKIYVKIHYGKVGYFSPGKQRSFNIWNISK